MNENAPSTIAMSAYSLAALGGPTTKAKFLAAFEAYQFVATPGQLDEALGLAVERGIMGLEADGTYSAKGPRGWVAMDRDPADEGGWSGWICKNLVTGEKKTLDSLLKEPA
jgi:hypothetical protein